MLSRRQSGPRAIRCAGGVVTQVYTHVVSPSPPSACPEDSGGIIVTPLETTSIWGFLSSKANTQTTVAHPSWNLPCSFCSAETISEHTTQQNAKVKSIINKDYQVAPKFMPLGARSKDTTSENMRTNGKDGKIGLMKSSRQN